MTRTTDRNMLRWVRLIVTGIIWCGPVGASMAAVVEHIRLVDPWQAMAMCERVEGALERSARLRPTLVIVEVPSSGADPDIARCLARVVSDAPVPVAVWIRSEADRPIPSTVWAIGLEVGGVWVDGDASIGLHNGPGWPRTQLLAQCDPQATAFLSAEVSSLSVRESQAALQLEHASSPRVIEIVRAVEHDDDHVTMHATNNTIGLADAASLGVVFGTASSARNLASAIRFAPFRLHRTRLDSGYDDAHRTLRKAMSRVDRLLDDAESLVAEPTTSTRRQRAHSALRHASADLERAETLVETYPELLREPPPGDTTVGHTEATLRSAWRNAFRSRRRTIDRGLGP